MRARDYDPRTTRFLSRDPAKPNLLQPESMHPYVFANSNPHVYRDPTGEIAILEVNLSLSINNVLAGIRIVGSQILKDYVRDKVQSAATEMLLHAVSALLPFDVGSVFEVLSEDGPM
jgi:hypothetical protein